MAGSAESNVPVGARDEGPGGPAWEAALIRRSRDGDGDAFGELLRFYEARVLGLVRRFVARRDEALELTQEVFLQAFKSAARFEQGKPFRPWLFKIAVNVCRNHRRLGARRESPTELAGDEQGMWSSRLPAPETALHERADRAQVERLLASLAEDDRALVVLRFHEDMPYGELARIFKRPEAVLKMRVHRALKRMRALAEGGTP